MHKLETVFRYVHVIISLLQFCSEVVSFTGDVSNELDERYYQY